ncbi:MAG: glycosyl transferase [Deltaproteobacteria bacterium]|jgi:UDP-GlcNAc:undecaprenyl-phosphate GlcNAc-1-phosphate transferase|nr:glycosyl transferase [Deltaproteobacteria bacterium]
MNSYFFDLITPFILAFGLSTALTPLVRRFAIRKGQVAEPRADRWHTRPTPLMGGVAIFSAFSITLIATLLFTPASILLPKYLPLLACASLVFALGLIDDIYGMSPQTKIVGQVVAAALLVFFGYKIDWFVSYTYNTLFSVFWIVGITNAFNLLDNMDGLAAGIAFISSLFLAVITLLNLGNGPANGQLVILIGFMGVLLGFLLFNFYPASIFMGDSGSLFIGFLLAGLTTHQRVFHSTHFLPIILVPGLILFIPILDTGFVSVMRTLFGRSIAQGGKDHSSHRLVAIGLPERKAVLLLYGFSLIGGAVALVGVLYEARYFFTCLGIFMLIALFFWVYLARVRVYPDEEKSLIARSRALTTIWIDFTFKKRIFEVLLDVWLVSFGYWLSYFLRFEGPAYLQNFPYFLKSLPIVLGSVIFTYFFFGIYRGVWRYTSVPDLIVYLKAVTTGIVLSMLIILFVYRFQGYSRTVLVIYWGICLFFLGGSRLSFRMISEAIRRNSVAHGQRVLIYGAGDKGEFALREILNNQNLGLTPVGFIDDDVRKRRRRIQGYKVLGGRDDLAKMVRKYNVSEVIVATDKIRAENLEATCIVCEDMGVAVRNLELSIK